MSIPYRRAAFSPKIFRLISNVRFTWYSCFKSSGNSSRDVDKQDEKAGDQPANDESNNAGRIAAHLPTLVSRAVGVAESETRWRASSIQHTITGESI